MTIPEAEIGGLLEPVLAWSLRGLAAFIVLCTLLPFLKVGWWVVRVCDFPRLQIGTVGLVLVLLVVLFAWRTGWRTEWTLVIGALFLASTWQYWHICRYSPIWPKPVEASRSGELRFLVTNVDKRNTKHREVVQMIRDVDPAMLLVVEINQAWRDALDEIRAGFDHHVEEIKEDGLGMALWSNVPITESEVAYLVSDRRPSIHATLQLEDGRAAKLVGVHPTPPGLRRDGDDDRYDSRIRDAELVLVAKAIADDPDHAWIVAGDFNDVAWSHTTQLFEDLSGLVDPRVGRGLYSTYHARYPLLRYPLDHIFVSPGTRVAELDRVVAPGSDHFAMVADLDLTHVHRAEPEADESSDEEAEEIIEEGIEDAHELGEAPDDPRGSPVPAT